MKFHFEAFDGAGNLIKGDIAAASLDEAKELLRARGATPYLVRATAAHDWLFREIDFDFAPKRASDKELAGLAHDLAVVLQAGVPLEGALRIAATTVSGKRMRDVALQLLSKIQEGAPLGTAMESTKGTFRPEYVRIVEAGETGAALGTAMGELADLLDRRVKIRERVRATLAYPVLLIALAALSLWIVLGLLVPAVAPIFLENGMPIPGVIAGLDAIRRNAIPAIGIGALIAAALLTVLATAHRNPRLRLTIDRIALRIPVLGPLAQLREAGRFVRTLATLMKAGVPPLQALQSSCPLVANRYTRGLIERAIGEVRAGVPIGAAMGRVNALPPIAQHMITVGEEIGRLPTMLMRAAEILEHQEQTRTDRALAVLTPIVTILVAGMIAAIILSVMGAILSINELALL